MRRRRITRKPTKGESIFGGIVCFAMGCFGLFALPSGFDPVFAGFRPSGVCWPSAWGFIIF